MKKKNCATKKPVTQFCLAKIYFSICPNTYKFFQIFFLILEIFFNSEKTTKGYEICICFRKKTTHNIQEVFRKSIETICKYDPNLFDKRGFRKLEKKSEKIDMYSNKLTNQF